MKLTAVSAVIGTLAFAACGGGTHASTPPTTNSPSTAAPSTTPTERYAALYTQTVAPADAAITTFDAQAKALPASASVADLAKIAAPLAATLDRIDQKLVGIGWPPKVKNDIAAVVTADSVVITDLRSVSKQTERSIATLKKQFSGDLSNLAMRVSVVVNELTPPRK